MKHSHAPGTHGHGMSNGSAQGYLRRFWLVALLLIPLLLANQTVASIFGLDATALLSEELIRWASFAFATIIFGFSIVFFRHAGHEIRARQYGMMTLVSLAVGAGYAFSVISTFVPALEAEFYLEISTLIWVLLFGHYLEARSSAAAGSALEEVAKLLPKEAHRLSNHGVEDVPVEELAEGDRVLVKPGEKMPADGVVESGSANVDESLISGESKPLEKRAGDEIVAGSICIDGSLTITLTRVGAHSTVGQIRELVAAAQQTKPRSQRIADRAAGILTFIAAGTALMTLLIWSALLGEPFVFSITLAITVLVIACPHALGLAIPTVTTITTSLAIENGIFIKDLSKIEVLRSADYVVFDKTGTLTKGEFGVREVVATAGMSAEDILVHATAIEAHSSHIIGISITQEASSRNLKIPSAVGVKNIAGKGMTATINGREYAVGNRALMRDRKMVDEEIGLRLDELAGRGDTVVYVADDTRIIGLIALSDSIKEESYSVVRRLHDMGIAVAMLTGDSEAVAAGVARELGIDTYFAEVLPEDKYAHIQKLQKGGKTVVMVGDGVNDAPALTQADVGVAIGAGTDVAVEAGDVILTRNNPEDAVRLLVLARKVYRKMLQNLFWALGYNVVAIPAAAGAFAYWGFFLRPEVGALLMSFSTVIVVVNALLLRRESLE